MPIEFTTPAILVLTAFVVLAGVTTYRYGRHDLLHPVVLVNGIMAYYVLLPAAWFLTTEMAAVPNRFDLARPARALTVALIVLLAMYVIILAAFRYAGRTDREPFRAEAVADANSDALLALGLVGFGVGLLIYAYYVVANGGLVRMFLVPTRTAFQTASGTFIFRLIGLLGVFGGYVTVLCALRPVLERPRANPYALAVAGVLTAITLFVAVSTRARMVILVPALVVFVYAWTAGWLSRHTLVATGTLVVLVGLGFSAFERAAMGYNVASIIAAAAKGFLQLPRLALVMVVIERVPDVVGYQWGATIPTALHIDAFGWPRYGTLTERIAVGRDVPGHSMSAMLPGELWVNFGVVGVLVGGTVYGAALRWAYQLRKSSVALVRGVQPALFVCVLLLWPTNLTWGLPKLLVRLLAPVFVAVVVAVVIQRWFPSLAQKLSDRTGASE